MEKMYPHYVYKAKEDSKDGTIKKGDLMHISREGIITVQKRDVILLTEEEFDMDSVAFEETDAYKVALTDTGVHIIAKGDN